MSTGVRLPTLALRGCFSASLLAGIVTAGCATPLGPGYTIEREQVEVRCRTGPPPQVQAVTHYRIRDTGNADLQFVEVGLPEEAVPADGGFSAEVDGRAAAVSRTEGAFRVTLDPPWKIKSRHELSLSYRLTNAPSAQVYLGTGGDEFVLLGGAWLSRLLPPSGTFSKGGKRPSEVPISISVPAAWQVASSGRIISTHGAGGETGLRTTMARAECCPYFITGRYQEQRVATQNGDALLLLWTMSPVTVDDARKVNLRLAIAWQTYSRIFGGIPGAGGAVLLVETHMPLGESPALSTDATAVSPRPAIRAFPGGLLVEGAPEGLTDNAFLERAERELARSWFGLELRPSVGYEILLGDGAREYAATLAVTARHGEGARRSEAARLLRQFDQAQKTLREQDAARAKRKLADRTIYSWEARDGPLAKQMVVAHAALFYFALEDRAGQKVLQRVLARLISAFGGGTAGANELRSALELETHQDLGAIFRQWLTEPAIPSDFRARYE
jgi:hypothetical protein